MKTFINSVRFALQGIRAAWLGRNFRVQVMIALVIMILAAVFEVSAMEWLVILVFSGLVLSSEALNSAIENIVNYVSPEFHPAAGRIKDLAAGAVLILSFFAAVAGFIIFVPYLMRIFTGS